jgi:hypothetical protein
MSGLMVSGHVEMQLPDGSWVPAPRAGVAVHDQAEGAGLTTDDNGRFAVAAVAKDEGPWTGSSNGDVVTRGWIPTAGRHGTCSGWAFNRSSVVT